MSTKREGPPTRENKPKLYDIVMNLKKNAMNKYLIEEWIKTVDREKNMTIEDKKKLRAHLNSLRS